MSLVTGAEIKTRTSVEGDYNICFMFNTFTTPTAAKPFEIQAYRQMFSQFICCTEKH